MKYDYEALKTRNNIEPYYAYANNRGVCITFALVYSQLLTQVGVESTIASGITSDSSSHVWNVKNVDDIHISDTCLK